MKNSKMGGNAPVGQKAPYRTPELVQYGTVSALTQGANSPGSDGGPSDMQNNMA